MQQLESDGVQFEKESYTVAPHVFPPKGSKWVFLEDLTENILELNERL